MDIQPAFSFLLMLQIGFSALSIQDSDGNTIACSSFSGKKVLIVNTAANSAYADQYAKLEQLYQLHKDSLVIIAVPTDNFGNEPDSISTAIADSIRAKYNAHYLIASQMNVTGDNRDSLYRWLTGELAEDQDFAQPVYGDFQKYLIDKDGNIMGVFAPEISPLDSAVIRALRY